MFETIFLIAGLGLANAHNWPIFVKDVANSLLNQLCSVQFESISSKISADLRPVL